MADKVFLRWGDRRNRADGIAERLGFELVSVQWHVPFGWLRPLRPLVLYWRTKKALRQHSPKIVLSHHTQPFGSVACIRYAKKRGIPVITDCHNGPFIDPLWQKFPFRQGNSYSWRHAAVNLVHNEPFRRFIAEDLRPEGRFVVLHDCIPEIAARVPRKQLSERPFVLVVCSWAIDEPIGEVVAAAVNCPEVDFWITGRVRQERLRDAPQIPTNVRFLGFVSDDEYDEMLRAADATLVVSDRDHVLTCACHEAIGAESALVISDSESARDYLQGGTCFVQNDGESIAAGVRNAVNKRDVLREEMVELKKDRDRLWWEQAQVLAEWTSLDAPAPQ